MRIYNKSRNYSKIIPKITKAISAFVGNHIYSAFHVVRGAFSARLLYTVNVVHVINRILGARWETSMLALLILFSGALVSISKNNLTANKEPHSILPFDKVLYHILMKWEYINEILTTLFASLPTIFTKR